MATSHPPGGNLVRERVNKLEVELNLSLHNLNNKCTLLFTQPPLHRAPLTSLLGELVALESDHYGALLAIFQSQAAGLFVVLSPFVIPGNGHAGELIIGQI